MVLRGPSTCPTVLEHLGRRAPARAGPPRHRPAARRRRRRPTSLWHALLPGLRHRPGLGAARQRPRTNRRSAVAETQVIRQLNRRLDRATRREAEYDELIREMLAQDRARRARLAPGPAAARPLRLGRRARPSVGSSGSTGAASTSSATSTTCARAGRRRRDVQAPRPGAAQGRSSGRARRPGRDDPRGGRASRPRAARWRRVARTAGSAKARRDGRATTDAGEAPRLGLGRPPARRRDDALVATGRRPATARERPGATCPGPSSSSCCAGSTCAGRPDRRAGRSGCWPPAPPGRGRPDLELVGAVPESRVRAATGRPRRPARRRAGPGRDRPARRGRRRGRLPTAGAASGAPVRRRYRVLGDPELARPVREALIGRGRPPGGTSAVVVVIVGTDLGRDARPRLDRRGPSARARRPWREWLASEVRRRHPAAAGRPGRGRRTVGRRVGPATRARRPRRPAPGRPARGRAPPASGAARPVRRRRRAGPPGRAACSARWSARSGATLLMWHRLRPVLAATTGPALVVPARTGRGSARARPQPSDDGWRRAGYAVHGDLRACPRTGPA